MSTPEVIIDVNYKPKEPHDKNEQEFNQYLFSTVKDKSGKDVLVESTLLKSVKEERAALVKAEVNRAWDHEATESASENEKLAAFIICELREFERKCEEIFGNIASEAIPKPTTRDMGGQFLTNKERIETKSKLFEIAKEVPKGSLLHLHFNAELNPERLLQQAQKMDNMYVWSTDALTSDQALRNTEMMFKIMPSNTTSNDIFSVDYDDKHKDQKGEKRADSWKHEIFNNKVWMRWDEFRSAFKDKFPEMQQRDATKKTPNHCSESMTIGLDPAENWILQKMVLSETEAYDPNQTVNGVWARFNQATRCFKGLVNYRKVYEWYINEAIDQLIEEKVMYAELRPMLMDKSIPSDNGAEKCLNDDQMDMVVECVAKKKEKLREAGKGDSFPFGLKIIYCTPRSIPKWMMRSEMKDCIRLKKKYPDLICGFDLVGAEDRKNHIGYYAEELVAFQKLCERELVEIPFIFHAGETLVDTGGSADPHNSNLFDAVAFKSKRIGHGFSLLKHPDLVEKFKPGDGNPGICIELCPISNELLHLCRNIKEHPYPQLLATGIPCTVNSDNPSLFSNSMSHEFYQIMVGSPTISVHSWKQLALWSIEYSTLNDKQKEEGKRIFADSWEKFCKGVVKDYHSLFECRTEETERVVVLKDKKVTVKEKKPIKKLNLEKAAAFYGVKLESVQQ
ncbi:Metallo-dependent hydrolase [Massarina eburnea CBS 473.64]|uniref:Metallo-dependent hydrolase n=1 Tax=Massarina eburnea CBS 473.64 TaxID=1395130 RepID=A0A6A6SF70_9PLEO|nr:Metallo-dependent hydrolase [Massarina eburnea CBS 473.64]